MLMDGANGPVGLIQSREPPVVWPTTAADGLLPFLQDSNAWCWGVWYIVLAGPWGGGE